MLQFHLFIYLELIYPPLIPGSKDTSFNLMHFLFYSRVWPPVSANCMMFIHPGIFFEASEFPSRAHHWHTDRRDTYFLNSACIISSEALHLQKHSCHDLLWHHTRSASCYYYLTPVTCYYWWKYQQITLIFFFLNVRGTKLGLDLVTVS